MKTNYNKRNLVADGLLCFATLGMSLLLSLQVSAQTFTAVSGMPDPYVFCVQIDGSGNKWAGTKTGGLVKYDNNTVTVYNTSNSSIPFNSVSDLVIDGSNNIWIAGYGGLGGCNWGTGMGIAKLSGSTWTSYNTGNSTIPNDSVTCITADKNGNIWIGLKNGKVGKFNGSSWTTYSPNWGDIRDIAAAPNGDVWVANFGGCAMISSGGTVTTHYNVNVGGGGFVSQAVSVVIDASGDVNMTSWMGSRRYIYNGTNWSSVAVQGYTTGCGNITYDVNGDFWMGNSSGNPNGFFVQNHAGTATGNFTGLGSTANIYGIAPESGNIRWVASSTGLWKMTGTFTGISSNVADVTNLKSYPNPFGGNTNIAYTLNGNATISLEVVNALGQRMALLVNNQEQAAGNHQYTFGDCAPGIYFVKMSIDGQIITDKIIKTE